VGEKARGFQNTCLKLYKIGYTATGFLSHCGYKPTREPRVMIKSMSIQMCSHEPLQSGAKWLESSTAATIS